VGQNLHLLATVVERSRRPHHRQHPAHAGRNLLVCDIQFHVDRELPLMTSAAQVIGTGNLRRADHGKHGLGAQPLVLGIVAARTRQLTLIGSRRVILQQCAQGGRSGVVERGPPGRLDGFQISAVVFAALRKNAAQKLIHLPRHLLMACSSRFFSSALHGSTAAGAGRN
jgi:hypothetical protein